MGKIKYLNLIIDLFKKSPVVSFESIKKYVKNSSYSKLLVHNLLKRKRINKISKGFYTIYNNPELAVFVFKPAYFGLQDALSFHNLWEQETIPVIITSRKVRTGIRKILGSNVLIRHVDKKLLFGFEYVKVREDNLVYPYSDIEKTLIDLAYFNEPISKEVLENILSKINKNKLKKYLKQYNLKTKEKINNMLIQS